MPDYHLIARIFFTYFSICLSTPGRDASLSEYILKLSHVLYLTRLMCRKFLSVSEIVLTDNLISFASSDGVLRDLVSSFRISYAVGLPITRQNLEAR
jgi:hypothetical protein